MLYTNIAESHKNVSVLTAFAMHSSVLSILVRAFYTIMRTKATLLRLTVKPGTFVAHAFFNFIVPLLGATCWKAVI